jgi:thiamine pyrophosphate-dependent acetolactate synthase large subunit-like protein
MGDEFYRKGANVQLGPGICLARVPRNGRNFEYISGEDPHLGYVMVQPAVQGIQSKGVVANAKHWVNNNQETDRSSVDEEVDERTRFEMYYPPFEGAIAADDPWCAGVFMGGKLEQALLEQCDYIVFAGFDPVELLPKPWKVPVPALWLDRVPNVEQTAAVEAELIGDLGDTLAGLAEALAPGGARVSSTWSPEDCSRFHDSVRTQLTVPVDGLSPNDVVLAARDAAPRDTVLVTDVGANKLLSVELWDAYGPHDFLMSNGLATMGFCLPAAQAVKLAEPNRPVLCLCGDAGFLMRLPELVTGRLIGAGSVKRPIVYVIFADNEHSLITVKQGKLGKHVHGLDFPSPGYADLSRAFGLACAEVDNLADYRKALAAAFERTDASTLIAARIDSSAYAKQFDIIREL